jgi:cell wall-associated NlpC family hydrolase
VAVGKSTEPTTATERPALQFGIMKSARTGYDWFTHLAMALGLLLLMQGCKPGQVVNRTDGRTRPEAYERTHRRPGYEDPAEILAQESPRNSSTRTRRNRTSTSIPERSEPTQTQPRTTTERRSEATNQPEPRRTEQGVSTQAAKAIAEAKTYLGTRYQWGGMSRTGVDCSGLMVLAFRAAGVTLPRVSGDQYRAGRDLSRGQIRPGDLVFFRSGPNRTIGHSGLVVEVLPSGEIKFIQAISSGVVISSLNETHWASHYLCACRILPDP